jgi:hypothetical protein
VRIPSSIFIITLFLLFFAISFFIPPFIHRIRKTSSHNAIIAKIIKYNLLVKHPMFIEFMDEYYYNKTQNWIKNEKPFNEPPIPLGRDVFLFNSIECPPFIKNFWEYYIKKDCISPKKLWKKFQNITLRYIGFHTIISA